MALQPQLASVTFATNNPTLSTVALEKPLCMFDSTEALNGTYEIYLYALLASGAGAPRGDPSAGRGAGGGMCPPCEATRTSPACTAPAGAGGGWA